MSRRQRLTFRSRDPPPGDRGFVPQARPAADGAQSRDVRGLRRELPHHGPLSSRPWSASGEAPAGFILARRPLALVHRPVRQLRRGHGRGAGQGPGRGAAQHPQDHSRQEAAGAPPRRSPCTLSPSTELRKGDCVLVEAGDTIPGDGEVIEGAASVNEAAVTGESAPVIRESGGDRSSVTGGTQVLSDWLIVRITANPGRDLPRPHDLAGRGGEAAEDAERDRAVDPARRPDADLPDGHRDPAAVLALQRARRRARARR